MYTNKNILLISADSLWRSPLGIGYIHAYLEENGFSVKSIYENSSDHLFLNKAIQEFRPSMIGLQLLTISRMRSFRMIEEIHSLYPNILIVIGGIHATVMYEQILHAYPYVIAVLGEGEETFLELAKNISAKKELHVIPGLAFLKNKTLIKTTARPLLENLDTLPFPKHEIFLNHGEKIASVLTSRGCPFHCSFCCLHHITRNHVRFRSVENIIKELEFIRKQFPSVTHIYFHDDTFLLDTPRITALCEAIIKAKLPFKFACLGNFKQLSESLIKKLEAAHFFNITLGLESANENILRKAHKPINKKDVIKSMYYFSKTKIDIRILLIVGLPGETWETIKETALFIQKLQKIKYVFYTDTLFTIAMLFPQTELYLQMKKAGLVTDALWMNTRAIHYYTLEHDEKTLHNMHSELLSYISLTHFFTLKGFLRQWIIVVTSSARIKICRTLFKQHLPRLSSLLKKCTSCLQHYIKSTYRIV